jgi:hypothetical protein
MKRLAEASSAELRGAAPYLFHRNTCQQNHPQEPEIQTDATATQPSRFVALFRKTREKIHLPSNSSHTEDSAEAAEHKRNDALCREASGQRRDALVLALEVEDVDRVTGGIASGRDAACLADVEVVLRDREVLLHFERRLDHGRCQTGGEMPVDVAVEEPNTFVLKEDC